MTYQILIIGIILFTCTAGQSFAQSSEDLYRFWTRFQNMEVVGRAGSVKIRTVRDIAFGMEGDTFVTAQDNGLIIYNPEEKR